MLGHCNMRMHEHAKRPTYVYVTLKKPDHRDSFLDLSSLLRLYVSLEAFPPFLPAATASSCVNTCALPKRCAARPPELAIWRSCSLSIDAKPRALFFCSCCAVSLLMLPPLVLKSVGRNLFTKDT